MKTCTVIVILVSVVTGAALHGETSQDGGVAPKTSHGFPLGVISQFPIKMSLRLKRALETSEDKSDVLEDLLKHLIHKDSLTDVISLYPIKMRERRSVSEDIKSLVSLLTKYKIAQYPIKMAHKP